MQEKLSTASIKSVKGRLLLQQRKSSYQFLCCCIILIIIFQQTSIKIEASIDEIGLENLKAENQTAEQDIRELKPGETVERQAKVNEIHAYQIMLKAGTSVTMTFGNPDIGFQADAIIPANEDYSVPGQRLPAGEQFAEGGPRGVGMVSEPMVVIAEKSGDFIIKLRFLKAGNYSINCSLPRLTTEKDRKYDVAQKLYLEVVQFTQKNRGESSWKMLDKLEERLAIYRSLRDIKGIIISLSDVADALHSKAEYKKAIGYYKEVLELFRSQNIVPGMVHTLRKTGVISTDIGNYQDAIDSHSEILSLSRLEGLREDEAFALHNLGVNYHLLADEQKARDFYEQSLIVRKSISSADPNMLDGQALSLINLGNLLRGVGGNEKKLNFFSPRTLENRRNALDYYQQALEIARKIKKIFPDAPHREPFNLLQIGNTYKELGNYSEAFNYYNQSLESLKTIKNPRILNTNVNLNRFVMLYMGLGNLFILKGEHQKSFEHFEKAITLLREGAANHHQTEYLNIIASDYYQTGETQKAIDLYNESLTLSYAREQKVVAAASLFEIARIERDKGNFANARNKIEEAIQTVESVRASITSQELRTTYFATVKNYYDFYIYLLMQVHKSQPEKGFDALALQTNEKAKSRSLLDLLSQARVDIKQGIDPALLEREQQARERMIEKAYQQSRLLLGKHTKEEAERIKAEVSNLTAEYESVQSEIKNKSPRYAALTQPASLNAKQIQQLLDSGTILLEYALGEKKSYLWAVTNGSITSFDLPKREEIEGQARKVYELLTVRNENPKGKTNAQRSARIKAAEEEYPKEAAKLSQMLLVPVASQVGNKRLLIIPDGALNYIPFSALPSPKAVETANLWQPLSVNHEIVTLPSASILALLREDTQNRKPAQKMLAVFADPVFSQTDVRADSTVAALNKGKQSNAAFKSNAEIEKASFSRDFERAVSDVGLRSGESSGLPRLPFSRREADSIYKVAPKNLSLKEVDFDASKRTVFDSNLEQYRILHFATHGLLNSQHPELSGIVLSLINKKGGDIDGFLRLQDIYNLKLSADLVVLSACNTALGKDVKGEGLVGLTRGFMYAGSPRVIASLWKVDDAATAEFMSIFYRKMLAENLRPAAALRAAQAEMMKHTRWKSPYYWAPFIIQGEWK